MGARCCRVGLLIVTIGVVGVIAIRIYAAGVLLYGQRPGLRAYVDGGAPRLSRPVAIGTYSSNEQRQAP